MSETKYLLVGYGTEYSIRNANPQELPRGDDGIASESIRITEHYKDLDDAKDAAARNSVSFGEEGGRFYGVILREYVDPDTEETVDYGIVAPDREPTVEEYRMTWRWAKEKLTNKNREIDPQSWE